MKSRKKSLFFLLRLLFAFGIIWYLLDKDILSLKDLAWHSLDKGWLFVLLVSIIVQVLLGALRWWLLLRGAGAPIGFKRTLAVFWIGQFYSNILGGIVGSDLSRMYYVAQENHATKRRQFLTIIVDRFLGLFALIVLFAVSIPFLKPEVRTILFEAIAKIPWTLSFGITIALMFVATIVLVKMRTRIRNIAPRLIELISRRNVLKTMGTTFLISVVGHLGMVVVFAAALQSIEPRPLIEILTPLLFITPVVVISSFLPLTPSGIGVGQAVMAYLFSLTGLAAISVGASTATLFQIVGVFVNCLGLIPMLTFKFRRSFLEGSPVEKVV